MTLILLKDKFYTHVLPTSLVQVSGRHLFYLENCYTLCYNFQATQSSILSKTHDRMAQIDF